MPLVKTKPKTTVIIKASPALRLEKAVANCIIADQGRGSYPPRIEPYWKAFKSRFAPGTPFTLYSHFVDRVTLYVYEENFCGTGIPRNIFNANCEIISDRLVEIADAAIRLMEKDCVEFNFRGPIKPPLPPDFQTNWRRFRNPMRNRSEILYLMSVDITPTPKLYMI